MAYDNYKIWFWDDSLSALGSTTNILDVWYKCGLDEIGEGGFTIPLEDTPARQYIEKYNVATFTCEIDGYQVCFGEIVIDRGEEIVSSGGEPGEYVVKGMGRLSKLELDRMNYNVISDGSQGKTATAVSDILALSQYATWGINTTDYGAGFSNAAAYLVTANETLLNTIQQALAQNNHHFVDIPGRAAGGASQTPFNQIYLVYAMDQLSTSVASWSSWHFKTGADPSENFELPILSIGKIVEEKETYTQAIVHGGGLGSGTFTMSAASGTKTAPSGYSYNFSTSVITNTALEATQPRKTGVAKISNIKPEDQTDATAVLSAAEQLVDAGQRWLEDRVGGYDEYYKIKSVAKPTTAAAPYKLIWPGWQSVRLEWSKNSPYNSSGSLSSTTIVDIDKATHVLEAKYSASPGRGSGDSVLDAEYLLGPAPRQERDGAAMMADELKEMKRRLDHADAQHATSSPPSSASYVSTAAPLLTASLSAALTNERYAANGNGTIFTDGGANSTFKYDLRTPVSVTASSTNSAGNSSTGHTHAITASSSVASATAVLLASDSNGRLRLQGLGIGAAAEANAITMGDDTWVGLGASAGRIVFDNQTVDQIEIRDASVIFNSNTLDPNVPATTDAVLHMIDADIVLSNSDIATGAIFAAHAYGTGIPGSPRFIGRSARGTRTSPTATQSGDTLAKFGGAGYDGTNFSSAARAHISIVAGSTYTPTAQGARILFYTTQGTGTTEALCLSLEGNGDLVKYNATESLKIVDAGSAGASSSGTVTDWIQVQVGVTTGYIKVYNSK